MSKLRLSLHVEGRRGQLLGPPHVSLGRVTQILGSIGFRSILITPCNLALPCFSFFYRLLWSLYFYYILFYFFFLSIFPFSICYSLMCFVYWNPQKSSKRKSNINSIRYLSPRFGMNKATFVFMIFLHLYMCLDFMFWARVICTNNKIGTSVWPEVIILQSPEKGVRGNFDSILDFPEIPNRSDI